MANKLRFLPLFRDEITAVTDYISQELGNPTAAHALLRNFRQTAQSVAQFPLMGSVWQDDALKSGSYRVVKIGNYLAFYVVDGDTVEFRRFLYNRSSIPNKLQ